MQTSLLLPIHAPYTMHNHLIAQPSQTRPHFNKLAIATVKASILFIPLLFAPATFAQSQIAPGTNLEDNCYVEWTAGDRTSLENICNTPNSTQPSRSEPANSQSVNQNANQSVNQPRSQTTVEIISDPGNAVYVNGIRRSQRDRSFTNSQPGVVAIDSDPTYFEYPKTYPNRRYIQYQRFYPYYLYQLPEQPFIEHQPHEVPQQRVYRRR